MMLADAEGLCDAGMLDVYLTWRALGGAQHPPSLMEIATWPATMLKDVQHLMATEGRLRRERDMLKPKERKAAHRPARARGKRAKR